MATRLRSPLSREIHIGDVPYKVTLSDAGVRITQKGKRLGSQVEWPSLIALGEAQNNRPGHREPGEPTQAGVNADVAREIRTAAKAMDKAREIIASAGGIPALLLADIEPDPVHGRPEQRDDWFVEPLLTPAELANILRIPVASTRALGIPSLTIHGEIRFRQSHVREYMRRNERQSVGGYR